MKKVATIFVIVFCVIIFTSCTDQTDELNERLENEREIELQLVDPTNDGAVGDEDRTRD